MSIPVKPVHRMGLFGAVSLGIRQHDSHFAIDIGTDELSLDRKSVV